MIWIRNFNWSWVDNMKKYLRMQDADANVKVGDTIIIWVVVPSGSLSITQLDRVKMAVIIKAKYARYLEIDIDTEIVDWYDLHWVTTDQYLEMALSGQFVEYMNESIVHNQFWDSEGLYKKLFREGIRGFSGPSTIIATKFPHGGQELHE